MRIVYVRGMRQIRNRDTLEIIIDSCSIASDQLRAIDSIITHITKATPRVYNDYKIVIPLQLGTEVRQRIYADFLRAELIHAPERPKKNEQYPDTFRLRQFWQKHLSHIEVVDTNISKAYRLKYATAALAVLENTPELKDKVVTVAHEFAARYGASAEVATDLNSANLDAFCESLQNMRDAQKEAFAASSKRIAELHETNPATPKNLIADAQITSLARHQSAFEKKMPPYAAYFMQALYSEPALYSAVASTPEFKAFRFNKGERAIEDYLFHERTKTNPTLVSLVISNDVGARDSINDLRQSSKNSVLVVSNKGVDMAAHYVEHPRVFQQACAKVIAQRAETPALTLRQKVKQESWKTRVSRRTQPLPAAYSSPNSTDGLNAITEGEWALRLAEVVQFGEWTKNRHYARSPQSTADHGDSPTQVAYRQ